jgi:hypothetical protein
MKHASTGSIIEFKKLKNWSQVLSSAECEMNDTVKFFRSLEGRVDRRSAAKIARKFMLSYLNLVRQPMPEMAELAMEVGKRIVSGKVENDEIERLEKKCWEYIELTIKLSGKDTPETFITRASLAVISDLKLVVPGADTAEHVDWFLQFARQFEDHSPDVPRLLEELK